MAEFNFELVMKRRPYFPVMTLGPWIEIFHRNLVAESNHSNQSIDQLYHVSLHQYYYALRLWFPQMLARKLV